MGKTYDMSIERDEDGYYVATVPELPECNTRAKRMGDLVKKTKEAIEEHMKAEMGAIPVFFSVTVTNASPAETKKIVKAVAKMGFKNTK